MSDEELVSALLELRGLDEEQVEFVLSADLAVLGKGLSDSQRTRSQSLIRLSTEHPATHGDTRHVGSGLLDKEATHEEL